VRQFGITVNKLPCQDTSGCECKPGRAQPPRKYWAAGSRSGSREGGELDQEEFLDLATTPALRATPPVPGGEFASDNFKLDHYHLFRLLELGEWLG